jgi:hypothetical protein
MEGWRDDADLAPFFPDAAGVPGIVEPGGLGGEEPGDLRDFDFRPDSARQVPVGPDRSRFGLVVP